MKKGDVVRSAMTGDVCVVEKVGPGNVVEVREASGGILIGTLGRFTPEPPIVHCIAFIGSSYTVEFGVYPGGELRGFITGQSAKTIEYRLERGELTRVDGPTVDLYYTTPYARRRLRSIMMQAAGHMMRACRREGLMGMYDVYAAQAGVRS